MIKTFTIKDLDNDIRPILYDYVLYPEFENDKDVSDEEFLTLMDVTERHVREALERFGICTIREIKFIYESEDYEVDVVEFFNDMAKFEIIHEDEENLLIKDTCDEELYKVTRLEWLKKIRRFFNEEFVGSDKFKYRMLVDCALKIQELEPRNTVSICDVKEQVLKHCKELNIEDENEINLMLTSPYFKSVTELNSYFKTDFSSLKKAYTILPSIMIKNKILVVFRRK